MTTRQACHGPPSRVRVTGFTSRPSLVRWFRALAWGLGQPYHSGPARYARYQLLRLWSPVSAVVVPLLVVCLLLLGSRRLPDAFPPSGPVLEMVPPPETAALDPLPPAPPLQRAATAAERTAAWLPDTPALATTQPGPASPSPMPLPGPRFAPSPVVFRGLPPGRTAAGRARAVADHGGGPATEGAVMRALRWLSREQRSDGSWEDPPPAMTGLALLAFLAHGDTPSSETEFSGTVEAAMRWLVANQEPGGRFRGRDAHDYSQPIAAYALCEAWALTGVPMVGDAATRAVQVILDGQHTSGAWDYNCRQSARDDTSYSGWCVQALKAAQMAQLDNSGLDAALRRAVAGISRHASPSGGFGYTGVGATPLTGVGVLCLQLLGRGDAPAARNGLAWLQRATCRWDEPWGPRPIYYWYYTTQAAFNAGGDTWRRWNGVFSRELVDRQIAVPAADGRALGYWRAPAGRETYGNVYSTVLCTLMLEVYYRYLRTYGEEAVRPQEPVDPWRDDVQVLVPDDLAAYGGDVRRTPVRRGAMA